MSEPWNTDEPAGSDMKGDKVAAFMLYCGLAASLTTLVVGSTIKAVARRVRACAGKNKE